MTAKTPNTVATVTKTENSPPRNHYSPRDASILHQKNERTRHATLACLAVYPWHSKTQTLEKSQTKYLN